MANILQTTFSNKFCFEDLLILIQISIKLIIKCQFHDRLYYYYYYHYHHYYYYYHHNYYHYCHHHRHCYWYCYCYASAFRRRRHYVFGLCVRASVRPSVRPKPEIPSFDLYMGPLVHRTNRNHFTACPSVRPSGEVSGHLSENAWRDWPDILHANVSWPSSELISLWPWSVDFSNFGTFLT